MTIYDYIDEYGIYSFEEKPFNEVDAMIFSFISYANIREIMKDKKSLTINQVGRMHLGMYPDKDKNIIAVKEGNKILRYMKDCKRYKDIKIKNYEYIGNKDIQFGVFALEYQKDHVFISYEGTDEVLSGWKEDLFLGSEFPTETHKLAIKYLNNHYTLSTKKIILGGHSKGGNLALVAGMYANIFVKNKIENIYSGDGPGLLEKEFNSKEYQAIKNKVIHIIPEYSIIGVLLNHENDVIVKATSKSILAHNIACWEIEEDHFIKGNLSTLSKEIDKGIKKWIEETKTENREDLGYAIDQIIKKANVNTLLELKENYHTIIKIIKESKNIKESTKKNIYELIKIIMKSVEKSTKEDFKHFIINFITERKKYGIKSRTNKLHSEEINESEEIEI